MSDICSALEDDLMSTEVTVLLDTASKAANDFSVYTTEKVNKILTALSQAAEEKAEFYAEWTVRETGFGNAADKVLKNLSCSVDIVKGYDAADFIEPKIDHENKIVSFPKPAGVIVALVPCTNPIMTVYLKAIISVMTRNAVILSPHPAAKECSIHAAEFMAEVAEKAGAPKGIIQIVKEPNVPLVNQLMQSDETDVILATGGPGMVHAAYSSGNPAIGVGPGNVACYVHETADIAIAAEQIISSSSFDNSLPCTCESVVLVDNAKAASLKHAMVQAGAYFVVGEEEKVLREYLFPEGVASPYALGKSAVWIAEQVGITLPEGTKILVIEIDEVGDHEPVSKEKMFPLLGFTKVDGYQHAIDTTLAMLNMMGKGHSAVIHSDDPEVVASFGVALPVCRIVVNTPGVIGSPGITTNLPKTGVIGTGYFGNGSVSENVSPKHLIQWTRVAYHNEPSVQIGGMNEVLAALK